MSRAGCHGCAWEWGNACNEHKVHMPSDHLACQHCIRNPNAKEDPRKDWYVTAEQALSEAVGESHE